MLARDVFPFEKNLVLAASAGTGKTHSLVGVVVHLVLGASAMGAPRGALRDPIDPARIVATTFSRKAAAEIRARLVEELERLAIGDPRSKYLVDLDQALLRVGRAPWTAEERQARARAALSRVSRAQVGTLHSFAATVVRRFALEVGLSPGFEMADEDESRARVRAVVERVLGARVESDNGVARGLARAAGGVDRLVEQLAATLERLEEEGSAAGALVLGEDDAARIEADLRAVVACADAAARDPKLAHAARAVGEAWRAKEGAALESALAELLGTSKSRSKSAEACALFELRERLSRSGESNAETGRRLAASWLRRDAIAASARAARDLLAACEAELAAEARRAGTLGFGQVMRAARDALRDDPAAAAELAGEIDVLLVDEFQDTSRLQRDLVVLLWEKDARARARLPGTLARIGDVRGEGLLVVGDRKQSIYGFRGADVSVFAEVCVGLAGAKAREALGIAPGVAWEPAVPVADFVPLQHNRRSTPAILACANALSARRFAAATSDPPALYEISYAPRTEDLAPPADGPPGEDVVWMRVRTESGASNRLDEAFAIAARVRRVVETGQPRVAGGAAPSWRDVAILAHTNAMLDACAFALAQTDVPFVVAGAGFYATREVRDGMAMLALLVDPEDRLAALEVLRGPWVGLRDETLLALTEEGRGLGPPHAWGEGERAAFVHADDRAPLARARAVIVALARELDRLGPAEALRTAIRELGLEEALVQLPRGAQRVANLRKLVVIASRATSARALLADLRAAAEREAPETEAATFSDEDDAVRLLTVHASKGLDFPIVFVPEVGASERGAEGTALLLAPGVAGSPPRLAVRYVDEDGRRLDPPSYGDVAEEIRKRLRAERARLAYVAATRAAHAMFFVGDRKRSKSGDTWSRTTAAALDAMASDPGAHLRVEEIAEGESAPVRAPRPRSEEVPAAPTIVPAWRRLPIATTSLQDFAHCPRRFQLVHLVELPERGGLGGRSPGAPAEAPPPRDAAIDARAEGSLAHRLLERIDAACFGDPRRATSAIAALLDEEGLAGDDPLRPRLTARVGRFLGSTYAQQLRGEGARIAREAPFVLEVPDERGRALLVRGTIDLLVAWPDGRVDVIDYKRARGPSPKPYAFQLGAYALAAHDRAASPRAVRTGIVFLGGGDGEPAWWPTEDPESARARLARLAAALVDARWSESFPRVAVESCRAIRCGYEPLCHPE